jgi:hypothetical protein
MSRDELHRTSARRAPWDARVLAARQRRDVRIIRGQGSGFRLRQGYGGHVSDRCHSSSLSRALSKPRSPIAATGPSDTFITPYYSRLFRTQRSTLNVKRSFGHRFHHATASSADSPSVHSKVSAGRVEGDRHTAATIDNVDFIDGAKRGVGRLARAQRAKAANHANGHLGGFAPLRENSLFKTFVIQPLVLRRARPERT